MNAFFLVNYKRFALIQNADLTRYPAILRSFVAFRPVKHGKTKSQKSWRVFGRIIAIQTVANPAQGITRRVMIAPSETFSLSVESRILRSLSRVGFNDLSVEHDGNGHVKIRGAIETKHDRFMIFTVARTCAEVSTVKILRN